MSGYTREEYRVKATSLFNGALRVPKRAEIDATTAPMTPTWKNSNRSQYSTSALQCFTDLPLPRRMTIGATANTPTSRRTVPSTTTPNLQASPQVTRSSARDVRVGAMATTIVPAFPKDLLSSAMDEPNWWLLA